MTTKNDQDKDDLLRQVETARQLLLKPSEKLLPGIIEQNKTVNTKIICLPRYLEAHIIALIKGGLS